MFTPKLPAGCSISALTHSFLFLIIEQFAGKVCSERYIFVRTFQLLLKSLSHSFQFFDSNSKYVISLNGRSSEMVAMVEGINSTESSLSAAF